MRSSGARARSASAASDAAPSPSSGAMAAAAALAASASSSTCRSRSRRASSSCSSPGAMPSVASTRAWSSASRAANASASRVSSSYRRRAARSSRHALRDSRRRSSCCGSAERIEDVELERRTREPALLELARHRDEALHRGCDILARDRPAPRVCARAPVAEDPPRDDEPGLALGPQLGERGELVVVEEPFRHVELGLDVRLGPVAADRRRVGARPEQQPDRLREDRLPRPRLAA